MDFIIMCTAMAAVVTLYFKSNPLAHSRKFVIRRFFTWFPLGMSYAFLYMARYNLAVAKNALGGLMTNEGFGIIFGVGTAVYGFSFLLNGPLVDRFGGKRGMLAATIGSSVANILMGVVTYLLLNKKLVANATVILSLLYGMNMFFQSYGAVSIIKVKAYWFHVRERAIFGAIFGTLISFGAYFAFDWGRSIADAAVLHANVENLNIFQRLIRTAFAVDTGQQDAVWLVFFVPALVLIFWAVIDLWLLKDTPGQAKFQDFDTHDASSGEHEGKLSVGELLRRIFTSRVLLIVALIEFTSGVIRNGILQWYTIFAKDVPEPGSAFFYRHWGLLVCLAGITGGFSAGWLSDHVFKLRRGPPAAIMNLAMLVLTSVMAVTLFSVPAVAGGCAVLISMAVIGVHSIMSGTAAADFGGRKAAATASGITDGFVYLGSGLQSVALGFLTEKSWEYWPLFLIPFTGIGFVLALRIWRAIPDATKKYLDKTAQA